MTKLIIKNLFLIPFVVFILSSCEWDIFKRDSYEGPNSTLQGGFKDVVTGELVPTDVTNGSRLQLQELGRPTGLLTRSAKPTGEYCDALFFAGDYSINFNACNFYPFIIDSIRVNKGVNNVDFQVTPYIRVKNANIRVEGDSIIATFNLQAGNPEVRLNNFRLYVHTDIYVGDQVTTFTPQGSGYTQTFSPTAVIDENTVYRLGIDLKQENNQTYFKYQRNYYFRVGAMAAIASGGTSVGTIRRNYSLTSVINFKAN